MDMRAWAENELDLAGYRADDKEEGPNKWTREGVLKLLAVFSDEGHSGNSAPFAVSLFTRLASWKPLSPLTGADDEWNEVGDGIWQNRRASSVFKEASGAYWNEGRIFWEWYTPTEGEPSKTHFTNKESRVSITFPFTMPDKPDYVEYATYNKTN